MGKVFFDLGMSLDGFIAGINRGAENPLGDGGISIHEWMFKQKSFREHLGMEGGDTDNTDNDIITKIFHRIGANIMGKRMFEEGEANWPEEAPFHTPVFVVTHEKREPWKRPGGTVFYFTDDTVSIVLEKAREAAREKDVRISGGADTVQQFVNAGLVDECSIHLAPLLLGNGLRLFDGVNKEKYSFEISDVVNSTEVTHLSYKIKNKS